VISCKCISASYRSNIILRDINFNAGSGDFMGIIGQNGAGKTTLLKILTGVKRPLTGTVILDGNCLDTLSRKKIAAIMAVVPQNTFIPPLFTVEDVVGIGRYSRRNNRFTESFVDRIAIDNAMKRTGCIRFRDKIISELSGGERQEVLIARALAQEPKVLLLDEPTANLDIMHQIKIMSLVKKIIQKSGFTAIMVIHDLNLAARFCNRLLLLHDGCMLAEGCTAEVLTEHNIDTAYNVKCSIQFNSVVNAVQVTVVGCTDSNLNNCLNFDKG